MAGEGGTGGGRKGQKTYEQVGAYIRNAISEGRLRPGDRLPPESDLARSLGVSRPTVREALKILEALNVLESSTGPSGGTFVRTLDGAGVAEYLTDSMTMLMDVEKLSLDELWAAREAVEAKAVAMAAARRTEQDLAVMRGIIAGDEHKDFDAYFPDITFHRAIADASQNRLLSLFVLSIHMTLRTYAERYLLPEAKNISQDQHRQIYESILERDGGAARERMQDHLRMAREVYRQAVPREALEQTRGESPERLFRGRPVLTLTRD